MKKSFGLLTAKAASKRIGVNRKTLRDWIRNGTGPARVLMGKRFYYQREQVDAWIEKCLTPLPVARPKTPVPGAPAPAGSASAA